MANDRHKARRLFAVALNAVVMSRDLLPFLKGPELSFQHNPKRVYEP